VLKATAYLIRSVEVRLWRHSWPSEAVEGTHLVNQKGITMDDRLVNL